MHRFLFGAALTAAVALTAPAVAAGARTVFAASPQLTPIGPTAAPDGSVWFAEGGASRLGRIAPDGTLTEYGVPGAISVFSGDLHVETVGPDGRVWFRRDLEQRVGVLDPLSATVQFPSVGVEAGAVTTTVDGAVWLAGDRTERRERAAVVRIARDGSRRIIDIGASRTFYAIAPARQPGVVLAVREDSTGRAVSYVSPNGAVAPIAIPAGTEGLTTVASGPAGDFIAQNEILLRVGGDRVARRVPGVRTQRDNFRRGIGMGVDGSIWVPGDPVVRLAPGSLPRRVSIRELTLGTQGIAVSTSNDAWVAIASRATRHEHLLRITPAGQIYRYILGTPPVVSAMVLSGRDADREASALVTGRRERLRVRVRCTAACVAQASVIIDDGGQYRTFARGGVRMDRAGAKVMTLRASRPAPLRSNPRDFELLVKSLDRSGYLRQTPVQRGAGRVVPVPSDDV